MLINRQLIRAVNGFGYLCSEPLSRTPHSTPGWSNCSPTPCVPRDSPHPWRILSTSTLRFRSHPSHHDERGQDVDPSILSFMRSWRSILRSNSLLLDARQVSACFRPSIASRCRRSHHSVAYFDHRTTIELGKSRHCFGRSRLPSPRRQGSPEGCVDPAMQTYRPPCILVASSRPTSAITIDAVHVE